MFKKLKQKIVEEVENSPLRPSVLNTSTSSLNSVGRLGSSHLDISNGNTENLVDISEDNVADNDATRSNLGFSSRSSSAMEGSFLGGGGTMGGGVEDSSFNTPFSTPMSTPLSVGVGVSRSRRSSSSSILSDISATPAILKPSPSSPVKLGLGAPPSSSLNNSAGFLSGSGAAAISDSESGFCPNLETLSREQLVFYFRRTEQNMLRYKAKLKEVSLSSHQEKFVRHMGEIKEQLVLEQKAKKHLEENFTMTLDEKEEQIKVLQTQIKLLKEAAPNSLDDTSDAPPPPLPPAPSEEREALCKVNDDLKQRINQLETLLMKCKENIKTNKDKAAELAKENESLKSAAEEKSTLIESLRVEAKKLPLSNSEELEESRIERRRFENELNEIQKRYGEDAERWRKEREEQARLLEAAQEENRHNLARIAQIEETLANRRSEWEEAERIAEEAKASSASLKESLVEKERKCETLTNLVDELREKEGRMRDICLAENETIELKKEVEEMRQLRAESEDREAIMKRQLDGVIGEKEQIESSNIALREEMEELRRLKDQVTESTSQQIASLKEQVNELSSGKDEKERANSALRKEVEELKTCEDVSAKRGEELEMLREKLEEISRRKGELEEAGKSSQDKLGEVWTSLNEIKRERDQLTIQLEETAKTKEEADKKWGNLLEETEKSYKGKLDQLENEVGSLKVMVAAKDSELTSERSVYDELKSNYELTLKEKNDVSFEFDQRKTTFLNESSALRERIEELQAALGEKRGEDDEVVKLQAVVTELEAKVTSLEGSLSSSNAELSRMEERNREKDVVIEKKETAMIKLEEEVANKEQSLSDREREIHSLADEIASKSDMLAATETELLELRRTEEIMKKQISEVNNLLSEERYAVEKEKSVNDELRSKISDLLAQEQSLKDKFRLSQSRSEEESSLYMREISQRDEKLSQAMSGMEERVEDLNREKAAKEAVNEKLIVSEELVSSLRLQLDEKRASMKEVEGKLVDAKKDLVASKEATEIEILKLRKEVGDSKVLLKESSEKVARLNQLNNDLADEKDKLVEDMKRDAQELLRTEEAMKNLREEKSASDLREQELIEKFKSLANDLSKSRGEKEEVATRLTGEISSLKKEAERRTSQIEALSNRLETSGADLSSERLKTHSLTSECEVLKAQMEKDGKGNQELNILLQQRRAETDQLRVESEELSSKVKKYEADIEKAKKAFDTLRTQAKTKIADGQEKLKQKESELEAEKLAAIEKIREKSNEMEDWKTTVENLTKELDEVTTDGTRKHEEYQSKVQKLTTEFEKTLLQFSTEHDGLIRQRDGEKAALSEELATLKEEKARIVGELSVVGQKLSEMEQSREKLIDDAKKFKADNQRSVDSNETLRRDLDASNNELSRKDEEITKLKVVVESLKSELDSSRSELSTQLEQDEELQGRLQELTEKLTSTESKLHDLTDSYELKLSEYQTALSDARREKIANHEERMAAQARQHADELQSYSSELETLKPKLAVGVEAAMNAKKMLVEMEEKLREKEEIENRLRQEETMLRDEVAVLKELSEDARNQVRLTSEELRVKSDELSELQSQIEEMKIRQKTSVEALETRESERIISLQAEIDSLKLDSRSIVAERDQLKAEKVSVNERLEAVRSELSSTKEECLSLETERQSHLNRMDAERRDWETTKNDRQTTINSHVETISTLTKEKKRLELTLETETRISAERQLEIESLVVEKKSLDAELQRTKGEIADRLKKVKAEAEERKNESVAETMIQFAALRESVGQLEAEIERLKSENEDLTSKAGNIESLRTEIDELRLENVNLKEAMKKVDQMTDSKLLSESAIEGLCSKKVSNDDIEGQNVINCKEAKLVTSSANTPEMEHRGDDSVGAEAGSHLDAHDDGNDDVDIDERRAFVTGNDVIIQELNHVVEKLEKEKSDLKASLDESIVARTTFESALEEIGRERESDVAGWRFEARELEQRIDELEKEKNRLLTDNSLLRSVSKGSSSARVLEESDRRIEELGQDFEEQLAKVHRQNEIKTNQLFKEFNAKMAEAEAAHQRSAIEAKKEADLKEQKMIVEHNEEMEELQNEIYNFDTNMEEIKDDYENRLREMRIDQERTQKSMESLNKTFEKEVEKRVVIEVGVRQSERENALREELVTLAEKWDGEGDLKGDVLCPESLAALDRLRHEIENDDDEAKETDVDAMRRLELTREIEELRERQRVEVDELVQQIRTTKPSHLSPPTHQRCTSEDSPSEADKERRRRRPQPQLDCVDASSSAAFPVLLQRLGDGLSRDQQLRYLKGTVIHQLNQLLKLRGTEAELRQRIDSMAHEESVTRLSPLFREPTEMEYLKQVLFQYMTGKEVSTMTKVIAAIMKFTPEETKAVVERTDGIGRVLW